LLAYLDDLLFFYRTEEEHFENFQIVLKLLQQYHVTAKQLKCAFFKPGVYFCCIVLAEGIKPDPMKVAVVCDWPLPEYIYKVLRFLGLAN
jgi:hypothetical protein